MATFTSFMQTAILWTKPNVKILSECVYRIGSFRYTCIISRSSQTQNTDNIAGQQVNELSLINCIHMC